MSNPTVGIIMGSDSDLDIMTQAAQLLEEFGIDNEVRIISAHRTPEEMADYARTAKERDLKVIIAGAGGSAHLPGMTASETTLPVIAVPIKREGGGHEAFWSNIKMPPGIPLATMPENGAKNAALLAIRILALTDPDIHTRYEAYVQKQRKQVIATDQRAQDEGWESLLH
jgi:5-(carboxyamino)imidazole ribonucleotide mutase